MRGRLRRTVERHPLLWVALAATSAVVAADGRPIPGLLCFVFFTALLFLAGRVKIALAALAFAILAAGLHGWRLAPQIKELSSIERERVRSAEIVARVLSEPRTSGRGWAALVKVEQGGSGLVWFRGEGTTMPARGETIGARGRFLPFPRQRNPGTFDVASWLFRQGAWGSFDATEEVRRLAPPPPLQQWQARLRGNFRHSVTKGLDPAGPEAAVIRAMVLGDYPEGSEGLVEAYRASGTLHAFSVSGMHVAMVGLIAWFVLKLLGVPRRGAVLILLAGMLAYAWVTGMKPPAVRSVIMAAALLGAFLVRRRPDLLNALGFALLAAILTNGHLIFQIGVQLSFGVVFVIGIGTAFASRFFAWIERREPYLPRSLYGKGRAAWLWTREWTASALAASTAASLGSVPLTLWHFGFVAPVSILASPLVGILVLGLMALALAAVLLSPLPSAQAAVNRANGHLANASTGTAALFAGIPGGNSTLPRGRPAENFLIVFDPGYGGGASALRQNGSTVLIDAGSRAAFGSMLGPSLRYLGLQPDSIALTHPDGGHIGGALDALEDYPVRQILVPVSRARSSVFRDLVKTAENKHVPTLLGVPGKTYPVTPGTWLEVLHQPLPDDMNTVADERVMVLRLHWQGWRILFLGDAGWTTERLLMASGRDLSADIIVAGRHRRDSSLGDDFLAAVKPRAIIASHADFPSEERIPPRWAAHCQELGIHLFHQGQTGAVTIALESNNSLRLRGFLDRSELPLSR
jgi:competence protein ComEC